MCGGAARRGYRVGELGKVAGRRTRIGHGSRCVFLGFDNDVGLVICSRWCVTACENGSL